MSGATSFEQYVALSSRPELLQLLAALTTNGNAAPAAGKVPPMEACGDSIERPNQAILFQSSTKRTDGWRVQLNPTTYCASIVRGTFSDSSMPTRCAVTKLHC